MRLGPRDLLGRVPLQRGEDRPGIEQDNFFDALADELEEGRELYRSRVSPDLYGRTNFYDRAIVDVILKSKGHVKSKIW